MIEKKTILDQIEITRDGTIQARLALLTLVKRRHDKKEN